MLRIGLTGGIGSGKTTVAKLFEEMGIPVFYADDASKYIMANNESIKARLRLAFGNEVYKNGILDRKYLASIAFNDPAKLELLNSIVHPATIKFANEWMSRQSAPYIIKEAALLFESGSYKSLDYIIGVSAPKELRTERVMKRDGVNREEVAARMSKQMNEEEKMSKCDFTIFNEDRVKLKQQVIDLHRILVKMAEDAL